LGKRWQKLHRLIYIAALAGVIHFYWLVKADIRRPAQYGFVLAVLLLYRIIRIWPPSIGKLLSDRSVHSVKKMTSKDAPHLFAPPRPGED
jgi:DMSO/TMAO reductase YedYZ heme-binding membrane subunit